MVRCTCPSHQCSGALVALMKQPDLGKHVTDLARVGPT